MLGPGPPIVTHESSDGKKSCNLKQNRIISINNNVSYLDLCTEESNVHIAYNNFPSWFEIVNNTMVDKDNSNIDPKSLGQAL